MKKEEKKLSDTFKSQDTEEWLDIHFTRPLGLMWANFFNRFDTHPNVITILSIILGAAAGIMFYYPDYTHTVIGILLLMWANLYDSADGQLARMTGKKTLWGRILDGFAGDVWFLFIYCAICLRLMPETAPWGGEWGWWIWLLGSFSGFVCHVKQAQLADYYRNIHLFFLKGEEGSELDRSQKVKADYRATPWKGNYAWKVFLRSYGNYTQGQEGMTPCFQTFRQNLEARFGRTIPTALRNDFRAGSRPLMKYTNILTFNTRAIALYISLLIKEPWLYFVFEITVLNIIFFYMRARHEALCRNLNRHLDEYK